MRSRTTVLIGLILFSFTACSQTEVTRTDETSERTAASNLEATDAMPEEDENPAIIEAGVRENIEGRNYEIVSIDIRANADRSEYRGPVMVIDPDSGDQVRVDCTVAEDVSGVPQLNCVDSRPEHRLQ